MRNSSALPFFSPMVSALIRAGFRFALLAASAPVLATAASSRLPSPDADTSPFKMIFSPSLSNTPPVKSHDAAQPVPVPAPAPIEPTLTGMQVLPLAVSVNDEQVGSWLLFERDGTLYAPSDAFTEWRVNRRPTAEPVVYQGQQWFALSSVPGFEAKRDFSNQSVELKFLPQAFAATRLAQTASERPPLSTSALSGFVNYDVSYTHMGLQDSISSSDLGALLEFGISSGWGVLTSTYAARNLTSQDPLAPRNVRRLETTFTRDLPDNNLSLRLGDSATRSSSLGRSVYFGGFQLSRNFSLSPRFISQPLPVVTGLSGAPSTVELYINDALRQTSRVPTGPFSIDNFPLLTGNGQARVVVRDALGRETVLVQDFFTRVELLEQGLSDWSVEAGAVRKDLGASNADYGQRFLSGLWRYGVNKELTMETRAELGRITQGAALGVVRALPFSILGQAGLAISKDANTGRGGQYLLGLEHTSLRHGFSLRNEGASQAYRQIGQEVNSLAYKRQLSGSYTYASEQFGSVGLGYARVTSYDQGSLTTYSANYSMRIGERSSLSFNAVHVNGLSGATASSTSVGVSLIVPLEQQISVSSSASHRGGQTDGYVSANRALTGDTGLSWRTLAGQRSKQNYAEGGLYYQGNRGLITADLSASGSQQTVRLGAQGGLIAIDGQLFATRRAQESFALVEVPGYADVGVGFQGRILARTNADGKALVPGLLPYQANSIRLDPTELPISAELDSIEQIAVPGSRNGVIVKFPVRSGRGALIKIVLDDGQPAPAGAELELLGDKQGFFVARRGEAFVTGLQPLNQLRLKWEGASCVFTVALDPAINQDDIARVGPLKCSGVNR